MEAARQQDPTLDMPGFVRAGGVERTVDQLITGMTLEQFAKSQGLFASKRLVDGMIASIAAFNGPDGKFDRNTFLALLQQRKIPEAQLRSDFAREAVTKALLIPVSGGARMPLGIAQSYATLLLEQREGFVGLVPTQAFLSAAPLSDGEVNAFYQRNIAAYTVPERRIIKYATFDRTRFDGKIVPTDAEIAAAYKADAPKYAARENRAFTQLVVLDKADAERLHERVSKGMPIADAAKTLGLEALDVKPVDRPAFARQTSDAVANAAFTTPRGQIAPLAQSGLGYHIIRVDTVQGIAARSVDQARPEIVAALTKTKTDAAVSDLLAKIDDDIGGGATFDEVAKKYALTPTQTPPLTAGGQVPDQPGFVLPTAVKPLLRDAFQAESGDDPQVGSLPDGTGYVLYHMDRVIPAAPKPLGAIRQQVATDAAIARAYAAARKTADTIVAKVQGRCAVRSGLCRHRHHPACAQTRRWPAARARATGRQGACPRQGTLHHRAQSRDDPPRATAWRLVCGLSRQGHPRRSEGRRSVRPGFATTTEPGARRRICRAICQRAEIGRRCHAQRQRDSSAQAQPLRRAVSAAHDARARAELKAGRPAIVWRQMIADTETPVSAFLKLHEPGRGDYLLESVEGGAVRGRYSLIGLAPDLVFRAEGAVAAINRDWLTNRTAFATVADDSLTALRKLVASCRVTVPDGLPAVLACLVGLFRV